MKIMENDNGKKTTTLACDYLVVGAGTSGMSFIDTLLSEDKTAQIILVDKNSKPGGHWTTSYSFVRMHQPSCNYGVNSLQLGKSRDCWGNELFNIEDRATGSEIIEYYAKVHDSFEATGRVRSFFLSNYLKEEDAVIARAKTVHSFQTNSGEVFSVQCKKLVNIHSRVIVPSMRKPSSFFPVHNDVNVIPINDLPAAKESGKFTNYVVLGAGKSGIDAVLELLRRDVDQSCIKWVISRDFWFLLRDGMYANNAALENTDRLFLPLLEESTTSMKQVFLAMEKEGIWGRLDPNGPFPPVFKGSAIDISELNLMRSIQDVVRMGRVQRILCDGAMIFKNKYGKEVQIKLSSPNDSTVFVDCMANSDGENFGYMVSKEFEIFQDGKINLGPMLALLNPSLSAAIIAYIEANLKDDDLLKNSCCSFGKVKEGSEHYANFWNHLRHQMKTMEALVKEHPPAMQFLFSSRTNLDAPMHHGGLLKTLWFVFGPAQISNKSKKIVESIESGKFSDLEINGF